MDEPAAEGPQISDGLDHLQSAARELVAAARSFLDVVEQVVDDDERFSGAAATVADLVGKGLGSARGRDLAGDLLGGLAGREPAWLRNDPDHPDSPAADDTDDIDPDDPLFGDAPVAAPVAVAQNNAPHVAARYDPAEKDPALEPPAPTTAASRRPASKQPASKKPAAGEQRTRRVKRIAVD